ncbi:MAG: sigma-70 family RNA polymerase sigma factor [Lachnospiraceae bacterium]|nr:sigma-70 family RNA polymerase sigma factor [Lachnospiraceae bacterium]
MGEICEIIRKIKRDKENFYLIIERFNPLLKKYTKLLYRDEREDVYAELVTALWEAIRKITLYDNDGQVVSYLSTAVYNKYLELYRTSRKLHDHMVGMTENEVDTFVNTDNSYDDTLLHICIKDIYEGLEKNKKEIFRLIFIEGLTDTEIASQLCMSRQYVNRMRKKYYDEIKKRFLM